MERGRQFLVAAFDWCVLRAGRVWSQNQGTHNLIDPLRHKKRFSQIKRKRSALSKNPLILFIIPHFLVSSHDPWGCGTRGKRGPWGVSENGQRVKWQGPLLEHLERLKRWSLLLNGVHSLQYSWSVPWSLAAEGSLATWADLLCLLCNQAAGAPSVKFHGWQPYSNTLTRILTKFIWASPPSIAIEFGRMQLHWTLHPHFSRWWLSIVVHSTMSNFCTLPIMMLTHTCLKRIVQQNTVSVLFHKEGEKEMMWLCSDTNNA